MTNHIAFTVQHIGHTVTAYSQIDHNVRQKIGADSAVNHTVKSSVGNNRNLQQKDHLLAVAHYVRDIRLHCGLALLKIIFPGIAISRGSKPVGIHFASVKEAVALGNIISKRDQFRGGRIRLPKNIRGSGFLERRLVVSHFPLHSVCGHLCGGA